MPVSLNRLETKSTGWAGSVVVAAAVILLWVARTEAQTTPFSWQLPFEQGLIIYEISGMETGRELLYIKDFGFTTARHRETTTTILGVTRHLSSLEITTPQWVYSFDLQERTGSKSVNPRKLMIEEYEKLSDADKRKVSENAGTMAKVYMSGLHGNTEQNAKQIHGFFCDRTTAMGSTVYTIHGTGLALMSETDLMGISVKSVAISIEKGGVDGTYFEFPNDIEVQHNKEADQMAQLLALRTIEVLKDPDSVTPKTQGFMGMPSSGPPEIPEEDQLEVEEAMETIKGLLGN